MRPTRLKRQEIGQIKKLVESGKTYTEISEILQQNNINVRGLSARSVRRFCFENKIDKKNLFNKENLNMVVADEISEVRN